MKLESTSGPDYGILTHRFISSQQWDRALATALEWLGRDPENLLAHRTAGQSLINLGRQSEARKHLERVLAGNPEDDYALLLLSVVLFNEGRFQDADESIRKAIRRDPNNPFHWQHLAHMSFQQGDLATARKCAEKARDLNPRDADIQRLLVLCDTDTEQSATSKILRYEQALELDPENADLHNDIGVEYLNRVKDYTKAEECFRRALLFEPASKLFRHNLFFAIKHRDVVYRVLCAPVDWMVTIWGMFRRLRAKSIVLFILMIPIWLLFFRFAIALMILWFMLVWPMTKVYEYLTIGDLHAKAGVIGAQRGGVFGYRKWSLRFRLVLLC